MKLVPKMTGLLLLSACAVLGVYGYFTVQRDRAMFEGALVQDGRLIAHSMRVAISNAWRADGRAAAERLLADASASEPALTYRLVPLDAPGVGLDADALARVRAGEEVVAVDLVEAGRLQITVPLELSGELALQVDESLVRETEHLAQTKSRIAAATLAVILASGLVAFVIGHRLVGEPMRALMDKADRVGDGDLSGPLAMAQGDEIGQLAAHMNSMCENLAREIDERRAAQEQLRHAERLATVGELAAGLAHELGTPLNVVLGRAMLLTHDLPESRDDAQVIIEQTERMIGIIRQLLDFARRGAVDKSPHDLRDTVRGLGVLLDPLAGEAGVTLRVDVPDHEVMAEVDTVQIQQALMNVTVNAIQASPTGAEVWLRVRGGDAGVELIVEDQGQGMSETERRRAFEPFFTTKEVGRGTGLGLPVAHGIVADHGGRIDVESAPGRGSRFVLYVPQIEVQV